jgi:tRNA threonylcarbamoyladenosine biosynthesis protein TsaB
MKILSLDASNNITSVAISENDNIIAYESDFRNSMQAETIVPMIEKCLNDAKLEYKNIDYLATIIGPGSFTGIRIGLSVAKAILFTTNIKPIVISNFEVYYFKAIEQISNFDYIVTCINAYRNQLYVKIFSKKINNIFDQPTLLNYDEAIQIINNLDGIVVSIGNGIPLLFHNLKNEIIILPRFTQIKSIYICKYANYLLQNNMILNSSITPLYIRAFS